MNQNNDNQGVEQVSVKDVIAAIHTQLANNDVSVLKDAMSKGQVIIASRAGFQTMYNELAFAMEIISTVVSVANAYTQKEDVEFIMGAISNKQDDGTVKVKTQQEILFGMMTLLTKAKAIFTAPDKSAIAGESAAFFLERKEEILDLFGKHNIKTDFLLAVEYIGMFKSNEAETNTNTNDPLLAMYSQLPDGAKAIFAKEVLD